MEMHDPPKQIHSYMLLNINGHTNLKTGSTLKIKLSGMIFFFDWEMKSVGEAVFIAAILVFAITLGNQGKHVLS